MPDCSFSSAVGQEVHSASPVTTSDAPIRTLIGFSLLSPNKDPTAAVNTNMTALHDGTVTLSAAIEENECNQLFQFHAMNYSSLVGHTFG